MRNNIGRSFSTPYCTWFCECEAHTSDTRYLNIAAKRNEIVVLPSNSRRSVDSFELDVRRKSREETTRLDLFARRHVFVPDTFRSTYRTQDVTSVVRYTRTYKTACRMLAARKRIQLDWTVCRANQPTRGLPNVCVCVCSNTKEKDTFLARGARTIRSFQSPPRNRTDEKRKDYFSTSSELILFVHRPSPFLPRTTVIFSFDRALARSPYLNSFRFVFSFPFVVFLFADLRFVLPLVSHDSLTLSSSTPNSRIAPL